MLHPSLRACAGIAACLLLGAGAARAGQPAATLIPDTPEHFTPRTDSFDYVKRDMMIPMRDGVKLHTVIVIPKGAHRAPIMLDRTPYNADEETSHTASAHMAEVLPSTFDAITAAGYIVAVQDVRGKHGSEGQYVNERPLRGPLNPTKVDHATDAWDTIDWLVKNTPESNGRVGMIGTSYDGMMVLMAMDDPHPALKAAVPINPVGDTWMGDDDFHGGAFRLIGYDYYYSQDTVRGSGDDLWRRAYDDYDTFLRAGSASDFTREYGVESLGFPQKLAAHPAYDAYWQGQALDKILATRPHKVPAMFVQGQWDQEDIYGAAAVWKATRGIDTAGEDRLVIGPWFHGQADRDGSAIGPIKFDGDTAAYFRRYIMQPFLDAHLKDDAPPASLARVTAYETGTNVWRAYPSWPAPGVQATPIYLQHGGGLGYAPEAARYGSLATAYTSDPAKPVPYRLRPIRPTYSTGSTWSQWLVDDQRIFSDRPDVLSFETDALTAPVRIAGFPQVGLWASTTGSDSDWVVKLIDIYPDEVANDPKLGGYELMISADIFRGRYRESFEHPVPIPPNAPELYRWTLPTADHVFLPGHRIMVQVQSSWFPLYDRNPQTYVDNIFNAKPGEYRAATQHVFDGGAHDSYVALPLLPISPAEAASPGAKPPV
ncbi:CocE/NonD family hydrolase [Caulobacter sp. S45]|uniref:CocE/NonD family hydrolase n=1 Tax=Caulobacter sp. S45 TaxID=1641861 RepID=UPI0015770462|nr:CocE/NonD family hydrolase [Caulobacter sp. S45]